MFTHIHIFFHKSGQFRAEQLCGGKIPPKNGAKNGRTSPSTAVLLRQEAVETRLGRIVWVKNMVTRILAPLHVWSQCTKMPHVLLCPEECVFIMTTKSCSCTFSIFLPCFRVAVALAQCAWISTGIFCPRTCHWELLRCGSCFTSFHLVSPDFSGPFTQWTTDFTTVQLWHPWHKKPKMCIQCYSSRAKNNVSG